MYNSDEQNKEPLIGFGKRQVGFKRSTGFLLFQ